MTLLIEIRSESLPISPDNIDQWEQWIKNARLQISDILSDNGIFIYSTHDNQNDHTLENALDIYLTHRRLVIYAKNWKNIKHDTVVGPLITCSDDKFKEWKQNYPNKIYNFSQYIESNGNEHHFAYKINMLGPKVGCTQEALDGWKRKYPITKYLHIKIKKEDIAYYCALCNAKNTKSNTLSDYGMEVNQAIIKDIIQNIDFPEFYCITNQAFHWPRPIISGIIILQYHQYWSVVKYDIKKNEQSQQSQYTLQPDCVHTGDYQSLPVLPFMCNTYYVYDEPLKSDHITDHNIQHNKHNNIDYSHILSHQSLMSSYKDNGVILDYNERLKNIQMQIQDQISLTRYDKLIRYYALKYENPYCYIIEHKQDYSNKEVVHSALSEMHLIYLNDKQFIYVNEYRKDFNTDNLKCFAVLQNKINDAYRIQDEDITKLNPSNNILDMLSNIQFFGNITYRDKAEMLQNINDRAYIFYIENILNITDHFKDLVEDTLTQYYEKYSINEHVIMNNHATINMICYQGNIKHSIHIMRIADYFLSAAIIIDQVGLPTSSRDPYGIRGMSKKIIYILTYKMNYSCTIDQILQYIKTLKFYDRYSDAISQFLDILLKIYKKQYKKSHCMCNTIIAPFISYSIYSALSNTLSNDNRKQDVNAEFINLDYLIQTHKRLKFFQSTKECKIYNKDLNDIDKKLLNTHQNIADMILKMHNEHCTNDLIKHFMSEIYTMCHQSQSLIDNHIIENSEYRQYILKKSYDYLEDIL